MPSLGNGGQRELQTDGDGQTETRTEGVGVAADDLPRSAGHPFYQQLNLLLVEAEFDRWIEDRCQQYYVEQDKRGQPSIPPGIYFRMLLVGYFEGLDSQRAIAWRCGDSLSLRDFLDVPCRPSRNGCLN